MLVFREGSNLKIQVATDTVQTNCPLPFADFETPHVCPVQDMTCTRCPCSPSCTYRPASHSRILQPELIGHAGLNFRAVKNIGDIGSKVAKSPFLCSKNIQSWTIPPTSSYKITSNIITPAKTTCALSDLFFLATHESIFYGLKTLRRRRRGSHKIITSGWFDNKMQLGSGFFGLSVVGRVFCWVSPSQHVLHPGRLTAGTSKSPI